MSKKYVESYNLFKESTRFPQGIDAWLGFTPIYVPIRHSPRSLGKSSYNFLKRSKLGIGGILYFSNRPLKAISIFGISLSLTGLVVLSTVLVHKLVLSNQLPGFASLMGVLLLGFGLQFFILGVISLYISEIFTETKMRPLYIIKSHLFPGHH